LYSKIIFKTQKITGFGTTGEVHALSWTNYGLFRMKMAGKLNCPPIVSQGLQHEKNVTNGVGIAIGCRKALMTSTSGVPFSLYQEHPKIGFLRDETMLAWQ
jgi:hypothetical protein